VHSLRATAAINALSHEADIAKVLGVARSRQRFHDAALRSAQEQAGGQPDVQGEVLSYSSPATNRSPSAPTPASS
jgi:hypothetical protein